jgi:hypothetical protein
LGGGGNDLVDRRTRGRDVGDDEGRSYAVVLDQSSIEMPAVQICVAIATLAVTPNESLAKPFSRWAFTGSNVAATSISKNAQS